VLRGYFGEAAGDISPAGEHDPFDFRADSRECRANIVAAVKRVAKRASGTASRAAAIRAPNQPGPA